MSDVARKIFPMEEVLALVVGKEGVDVKELAGYLTGRSLTCSCCAAAVAPLAAGWLASLYPQFVALAWNEDTDWDSFVETNKRNIGDNVSVPPMNATMQGLAAKTLDALADLNETVTVQRSEIVALQGKVATLEPFEGKAQELDKKCAQLEAKVKSLTADIGGLRKELMPFQGKMPVDQQELVSMIKDTIKDNLKGFVAGTAVAGAVAGEGAAEAEAESAENAGPPIDDFGFGTSGADGDGFGF